MVIGKNRVPVIEYEIQTTYGSLPSKKWWEISFFQLIGRKTRRLIESHTCPNASRAKYYVTEMKEMLSKNPERYLI